MTPDPLRITFEREDGTLYDADLDYHETIRLVDGEQIEACNLTVGDEIESHHSQETGGRGHRVIR